MKEFCYQPAKCVPFRDVKVLERVRKIKRNAMDKHKNPDFKIKIVPDSMVEIIWITDMVVRIKEALEAGRKLVMILPNPCPIYKKVAYLLNQMQLPCKHLHAFAMDEYANEKGEIAPETWRPGFTYAMKNYFYKELNSDLRPPEKQFVGLTNKNVKNYSDMILEAGGADICYSGPGWTGHVAFIEPDAPEFKATLKTWLKMKARVCTLSPFTIAQNSLHGSFGKSGDLSMVPPKAATIGPFDIVNAKHRIDVSSIRVHGTSTSWQRMITRLCTHGPVTPLLPTSIHQLLRTDKYISESLASDIEPDWDKEY
jgi:glucosamine-6-phosphate deaminase